MDSDRAQGRRYRLALRGELGEPFGFLFERMQMERIAGTTVLTGRVIDQTHLHGLIQRTQELGLELISLEPADEGPDETERPRADRAGSRGAAERGGSPDDTPKDEIAALTPLPAATAAPASGSQTVHAADHGTAELAVRPGHGDQVREEPASRSRGRGGRLIGHASEELSKQIRRTSHQANASDRLPGRCAEQRTEPGSG